MTTQETDVSTPGTVDVEWTELTARAAELEAPIPTPPAENPSGPCGLEFTTQAAQQIQLSADNMRIYLATGERERTRLATSLRNAAKGYQGADEGAGEAIDDGTSVPEVTPVSAADPVDTSLLGDTPAAEALGSPPCRDLLQTAQTLEAGDNGAAFLDSAAAWDAYQRPLLEARLQFRPFTQWSSGASAAVESNFDSYRQWLDGMATMCGTLASQARGVAAAHQWAMTQHPTSAQVKRIDQEWAQWSNLANDPRWPYKGTGSQWDPAVRLKDLTNQYAALQTKSASILTDYQTKAVLPLRPLSPSRPTPAYSIPDPTVPPPDPTPVQYPTIPAVPDIPTTPSIPSMPMMPSMPSMPSMPTTPPAPPAPDSAALTAALKDMKPGSVPGGGLKPASFGGAGAPSMSMQPAMDSGSATPGGAGPGAASGRGLPSVGGAMGGGMGGMAPMAPGGQGQQGAGKGKRMGDGDDALYTEERPWTEGVVGLRRAKDAPGGHDDQ